MAHRTLKPTGYSVLLGKGLAEALAYLTELPLLCGDVETGGLGPDMQLLMSSSAGTCVGEDGHLCRWVHDVKALDAWERGGGSGSEAAQRLATAAGRYYGAVIEVANAADATQATMATAAAGPGYDGVPRVMAVFSSSHFDERMWDAAVGPQGATVPIVNMAPYIWCVLLLLSFIIVIVIIVIIIIMTITITIIIITTCYYYYAWRLPPSSPARCPACHMPACRHFTSHAAYASNPWQKKLSGKLDSMVRVYCPAGALAAWGVLQPPRQWNNYYFMLLLLLFTLSCSLFLSS
jgi:hypothetical protein